MILLVEDEAIIAMSEKITIEKFGYDVVVASSGREAVDIALGDESIGVVLMDIDLGGGMDGTQTAREILAVRNIPIVFLTSHAEKKMVEKVKGITRYGYVLKDAGAFVLQSSIEMALELFSAKQMALESEARFSRIFSQSPLGVAVISLDLRFLQANMAFCEMMGYSEEEFRQMTFTQITHPDDKKNDIENTARLRSGEIDQYVVDKRYIRKDGSVFWGHVSVKAVKDDRNNPICYLPFIEDITERKKAEYEIRRNDARLSTLAGILQHQSSSIQEFLDYALDEAIKLTRSKIGYIYFYNEEKSEFILNTWSKDVMKECTIANPQTCYELDKTGIWGEAVRQRREIIVNDFQAHHPLKKGYPKGHAELHRFMTVPVIQEEKIVAVIGMANKEDEYTNTDVLELTLLMDSVWKEVKRRQTEQLLLESEKKYEAIFNGAVEGILIANIDTKRFIFGNPRICSMLGYTLDEIRELSVNDIHPPDELPRVIEVFEAQARGEMQLSPILGCMRKDGSVFFVEIKTSAVVIDNIPCNVGFFTDVTERRKVENALRESEARFGAFMENLPTLAIIKDHDLRPVYFNPPFQALFDSESWLGKTPEELFPPEVALPMIENDRKALSTGFVQYEETWTDKKGEEHVFDTRKFRIDMQGGPPLLGAIIIDITDWKRSEEQLLSMTQRLDDIIESIPDAVFVIDSGGRVMAWNRAIEIMMGVKKEEILGKGNYEYSIPMYGNRHPILIDLLDRSDAELESSYKYVHRKDGKIYAESFLPLLNKGKGVHLWGVAAPLFDRKGNRFGSIEVIKDVTEMVVKEEALLKSEKRYSELLEEIVDGYYEVDVRGTFVFFNDAMCKILGYSCDELKGMNYRNVMDKENAGKAYRTFNNVYSSGRPDRAFDWELTRKDGSKCQVETSVSLMRDSVGEIIGFHGIARDVTDRKKLQEQLLHSQKMESIGILAGGIAHDFNNMLTPIIGYAQMLIDEHGPDDPRRDSVEHIIMSAERSRDLVRRLLAFARKQALEIKPLDLNAVVVNFEKMLRRTLRENIEIKMTLSEAPCSILADVGQIEQIILNLSVNAQDAMPEGGLLCIETDEVRLDDRFVNMHRGSRSGDFVTMTVRDTGVGMDRDTIEKVFQPFFTTKAAGHGTGLGLATVYGIVKQHGGYINVESEPGRGSTFRMYFPRAGEVIVSESEMVKKEEMARGTETILVVEDEFLVRNMVVKMLETLGYTVLQAGDGKTARALLDSYTGYVDLLLTDVVLVGESGKELYEKLHTVREDMKVVYMSGYTSDLLGHNRLLDENIRFIQKPFSIHSLSQKIRDALENR